MVGQLGQVVKECTKDPYVRAALFLLCTLPSPNSRIKMWESLVRCAACPFFSQLWTCLSESELHAPDNVWHLNVKSVTETNLPNSFQKLALNIELYKWLRSLFALLTVTSAGHVIFFLTILQNLLCISCLNCF